MRQARPVPPLQIDTDAADVGFAADRLARIDRHFQGYIEQKKLPGGADLEQYGRPLFAETSFDGVGFGLGFSVVLDAAANKVMRSEGEYSWGGAASTIFRVDPVNEIVALFLTQLLP